MPSGPTSGRVYAALRHRLTHRRFRPGERLDPVQLAEEFGSSVTPVRDAMHILVGEGLVGTGAGEGFHFPHLDEPALNDLYDWNLDLLLAALRRRTGPQPDEPPLPDGAEGVPALTAAVFARVARRSGNREHVLAMRWVNARLNPIRLVEGETLPDPAEEIAALIDALGSGSIPAVRRMIAAYHSRRKRLSGKIIRSLYRAPDDVSLM